MKSDTELLDQLAKLAEADSASWTLAELAEVRLALPRLLIEMDFLDQFIDQATRRKAHPRWPAWNRCLRAGCGYPRKHPSARATNQRDP